MERDAEKGVWIGLVEVKRIPAFAAFISNDIHEWQIQSPDVGEVLRAWNNGRRIIVKYDGKNTRCGRACMGLWHVFAD